MSEITERMMQKISDGSSMNELCSLLANEISSPVAVALTSETLIGHSPEFDRDMVKEFTDSTRYMSTEEINDMHASFDKFLYTGKVHVQAWPYLRHKQINCGCLYRESLMAVLLIPLPERVPEEIDFNTVEDAAKCFGIWLAANGYITNRKAIPEQNFLAGLLNEDIDMELHRTRLPYFSINTISEFRVIWIRPYLEDKKFEHHLARFCRSAKRWWHVPFENGFVVLLDARAGNQFEKLRKVMTDNHGRACISEIFTTVTEIRQQLETVRSVLDFCMVYGIQDPLIFSNDYKLVIAFAYARNHLHADLFKDVRLEKIAAFDREHSSFYLDTLRACFECKRDPDKMAEKLHLQKNSVFYRLNRLKELFSIDLDDPFQLSSLFYALLVHDHIL